MGVIVFQFRYEIDYGKVVKDEEGRTDDDFDDDEEKSKKNSRRHRLKDDFGTIRERASPAILKYYIDKRDDYESIRATFMLFVPFRNEHSEITSKGEASCIIRKITEISKHNACSKGKTMNDMANALLRMQGSASFKMLCIF